MINIYVFAPKPKDWVLWVYLFLDFSGILVPVLIHEWALWMSKWSHLTLSVPELTATSIISFTTVEAKSPPLASQVDQVYLNRWTNHIKIASLGTDQVFGTDGFTYVFVLWHIPGRSSVSWASKV